MKLKYKKVILLTTMSILGIGLLTLSVGNDKTPAKETPAVKAVQEAGIMTGSDNKSGNKTITKAPTATPTPKPVYNIEEDKNTDIEKLFKSFYKAKNEQDVDAIKKLLSDPKQVESQDELQKKTQYIEEYDNIKSYTKKGYLKGTYIVYVYHEIKFTGINTPAPGLSKFYVVTDSDNKLKIFSGDMDEDIKDYYDSRNEDTDVQELIDMTNKESKKAMKSDEELKKFWDSINELAKKSNTQAQGDSEE